MSIQFNLLPWREEQRAKKLKSNKSALIFAALIGVFLAGGYYAYENVRLTDHKKAKMLIDQKNKSLLKDIAEKTRLDKMKQDLNNQIDSIEALQADRASVTHMAEELSTANNQQLFLTDFSLKDGIVSIVGIAENDTKIAELMENFKDSRWFQEPTLGQIYSNKKFGGEIKNFSITSKLLLPGSQSKEKE